MNSWPPDQWKIGGGGSLGLDLLRSRSEPHLSRHRRIPGPWNPDIRPGDNKWTCGIFARDPDTGEAKWFYQWSPHDVHDWDGINEQILLDLDLNGSKRKVLVRAERNGYVYVMDRLTGEVLSADTVCAHHDNERSRFENRPLAVHR